MSQFLCTKSEAVYFNRDENGERLWTWICVNCKEVKDQAVKTEHLADYEIKKKQFMQKS
jgi:hypothetical protein